MTSAVSICNQAIFQLGGNPITSLDEPSTNARVCKSAYEPARRSLLRLFPFKFAIKRSSALAVETTEPNSRYKYSYVLPSDFLRLLNVYLVDDYKVENNRILTNSKNIQIRYVFDNADETKWDSLFQDLMVLKIKSTIAFPITKERSQVEQAIKEFTMMYRFAVGIDSTEDPQDTYGEFDNELIEVRY